MINGEDQIGLLFESIWVCYLNNNKILYMKYENKGSCIRFANNDDMVISDVVLSVCTNKETNELVTMKSRRNHVYKLVKISEIHAS